MANQFSNRPKFCDFLERYQAAFRPHWSHSQYVTQRVGIGRFDEWLKICGYPLGELDWPKLLEFHRFIAAHGVSVGACQRGVQTAKHAIRWGIEKGELSQKIEDVYTSNFSQHRWDAELPELSDDFLSKLEPTRPGSFRQHRYAHLVFHVFLKEKGLTYRRLKIEHIVMFIKYLHKKDLQQRTRMTISRNIRSYLRWLYQNKKIRLPVNCFKTIYVNENNNKYA